MHQSTRTDLHHSWGKWFAMYPARYSRILDTATVSGVRLSDSWYNLEDDCPQNQIDNYTVNPAFPFRG